MIEAFVKYTFKGIILFVILMGLVILFPMVLIVGFISGICGSHEDEIRSWHSY